MNNTVMRTVGGSLESEVTRRGWVGAGGEERS